MRKLSVDELDMVVGGTTYYTITIQSGEPLTRIAHKFKTTVERLEECNNIENVDYIPAGKTIKICLI